VSAIDAKGAVPVEVWRAIRQSADDGEWLRIELFADHTPVGEAWDRFSDALNQAVSAAAQQHSTQDAPSHRIAGERESLSQVASGLVETARVDARCRRHGVPLHVWLGGAIRTELPITLPVRLTANGHVSRRTQVEHECVRTRAAADSYGVRSFSLHDASTDPRLIADSVIAVRNAMGPDARLTLRLAGQLPVQDARALVTMIRGCDLLAVVDLCDNVPANARATNASLPALGLSASDYERAALLDCFATTPPSILFVDPIREGGPFAARRLAAVASVLHVDVAFTAAGGGPWLAAQCASLAAVLPAACQPVELPLSWTPAWLDAAGLSDGAMMLDAIPRLARLQGALAQD
jgi:L-alanine-DL-glutamate epimerase-like enolase superfamily enzyme